MRRESPLRQYILTPNTTTSLITRLTETIASYAPHLASASTPVPIFPQGGVTRPLLVELATPQPISNVAVATLLIYASEGDNIESAYFFAEAIVEVLELQVERNVDVASEEGPGRETIKWRVPRSWELGLSGRALGRERVGELFG